MFAPCERFHTCTCKPDPILTFPRPICGRLPSVVMRRLLLHICLGIISTCMRTTLHFIMFTNLHYITPHNITLHYTKYTTLHCIALHYPTLYSTLPCSVYTILHYITQDYTTLFYITLLYTTLHSTKLNTKHYSLHTPLHHTTHHIWRLYYPCRGCLRFRFLREAIKKKTLNLWSWSYLTGGGRRWRS